uniref:Uncharacterized protein n=1 Tax=Magnetococcus massalia (strain MO-1) TaxID=451514 RepID=A0A1S7LHP1_MAGMO|nr:Protein of unknown function [Candidatus Magnetococcus massalia]
MGNRSTIEKLRDAKRLKRFNRADNIYNPLYSAKSSLSNVRLSQPLNKRK